MVSIVILASGFSRRMNKDKLLLKYKDLPLIEWTIKNAAKSKAGEIIVVYRDERVKEIATKYKAKCIFNPNAHLGQSEGIKLGLREIELKDGVMFLPGDMPLFKGEDIDRLIDEYEREKKIIIPTCLFEFRSPIIFPFRFSEKFFDLQGDRGGKTFLKDFSHSIKEVHFKDVKIFQDVDVEKDLKDLDKRIVLIKGAGDIASGVALRLKRCGFKIIMTEIERPSVIRRRVAFASCVYEKSIKVEDTEGILVEKLTDIERAWREDKIPVLIDENLSVLNHLNVDVLVDAVLAKKNLGTKIDMAPITIGLGPGFEAGVDVNAVVETNRGHYLGRVYLKGRAEENTGIPGDVLGYREERVIRSPKGGKVKLIKDIGDYVKKGDEILYVDDVLVTASIDGVIRGLIMDGYEVYENMKIGDIDPRGNKDHCYTVSDKALAVAGGVLEAIFMLGGF